MRCARLLVVAAITLASVRAHATGEVITEVRIAGNQRTGEDTVRSMAGVNIGDFLEADTLDTVRERLNNSGLFSDVNVYWEPYGAGVRVNIIIKDKFPWAPVPTFSRSPGNTSFGLLFVHGNLFGRGKQLVLGARIATVDSGAVVAYRDPALFGTWLYWQLQGGFENVIHPEFDVRDIKAKEPVRATYVRSFNLEGTAGIAWFRRIKTQFTWHLEKYDVLEGKTKYGGPFGPSLEADPAQQYAQPDALVGYGRASLIFDWRVREYSVMRGPALTFALLSSSNTWKSDIEYWKANVSWEHGVRLFRKGNFIYRLNAYAGKDMPLWSENTAGGLNLRGYVYKQYRGDTQGSGQLELHFPLFSIKALEFRGLMFYDAAAVWFRESPEIYGVGVPASPDGAGYYSPDKNGRVRLPPAMQPVGFTFKDSVHNAVGAGLRFFLRSVAVPLVGIDYGYGIESRSFRFFIVVGA